MRLGLVDIPSEGLSLKVMRQERAHTHRAMGEKWPCSEENLRQLERRAHVRPATVAKYIGILDQLDQERVARNRVLAEGLLAAARDLEAQALDLVAAG
jgi:hypothetical protein